MQDKLEFKARLKQSCIELISNRIATSKSAMDQAQETANNEGKSSAGDKYETSRAMGHLDRDMNARQLDQALNEQKLLNAITTDVLYSEITSGCVFELTDQFFFVAAGLGSVSVNNQTVMVISPLSPFFAQLKSKKEGDEIMFQNKKQKIKTVF